MKLRVLISDAEWTEASWRRLKRVCRRYLGNPEVMERIHTIAGEVDEGRIGDLRAEVAPARLDLEGTIPPPPEEGPR